MTALTEETLSVSGMLLSKTFGQQDDVDRAFRDLNARAGRAPDPPGDGRPLVLHDHRHDLLDHAGVRVLARRLPRDPGRPDPPRRSATSSRSRRSRAACSSRSASCSTSRSRSRARSRCSTGSSSTSSWTPRSSTRPTRSRSTPPTVRGQVRFRDVSFRYPTAAVPSSRCPRTASATDATADADGRGGRRGARWPTAPDRCRALPRRAPSMTRLPSPIELAAGVRARGHRLRGRARASSSRSSGRRARARRRRPTCPAAVRRRRGRGRDRRHRRPPDHARVARRGHRLRDPGDVPVPRIGPRRTCCYAKPDATDAELEAAARGRRDPRPDHGAARGLRHDRRRARLQAVGRREAADRDRPGAAQGPADPHPRRGDVGPRHRQRAAHPGGVRAADGGPDDDRHRPPPVDDPARRPDPRLRARPDRRARHARRAARPRRALRAAVPRAVPDRDRRPRSTARDRIRAAG